MAVGSFALSEVAVHNLALRILQNPYWKRLLGMSSNAITMAEQDIKRHGMWLGGDLSFSGKPPAGHQGGRRRRTRKHKKRRKKTRHRRKRGKKTRHKKKKRTRKH